MAGNEDKDDALAEKAYAAAAEKAPTALKAEADKGAVAKDLSAKNVTKIGSGKAAPAKAASEAKPVTAPMPEAKAASAPVTSPLAPAEAKTAPVESAKPAPVSPAVPEPVVAAPIKAVPTPVAPVAAKAPPVKSPAVKAPAKPKVAAKPKGSVKPKAAPKTPAKAAAAKLASAKPAAVAAKTAAPQLTASKVKIITKPAVAARAPVVPKPAPVAGKPDGLKATPGSATKTGPGTTGAAKTSFAGLISNFMLEDTTMDMSANINAFQDAVTEAQGKAKAAFEKSSSLMGELGDFTKGNLEAVVESGKILAEGLQGISSELVAEGRTSFATFSGDIKELAAVKSPTDFFKLQGDILRKNFDTAVAYGSKNSETMLKLVSDAIAPISGRVSVAMEKARHVSV
ncbi:phasin family protein [Novosphingobium sp. PhB165]|uniref:phasin family protein n=1 Tax=Novosphingobium sp. PhB165 TaxID=2485105 RepID=UPI001053572E|nr:phasin family protein [Novosphingobium sp. PhB165]TCM17759.1 phasin family protein [Novosphingobium sp. PhB165]